MVKSFKVKNSEINDKIEKKISSILIKKGEFGDYNINLIKNLSKEYNLNKKLLISLRSQLLKNKVIEKHYLVKKFKSKLIKDYDKFDIISLSKNFDISPLSIMRMIIKDKYKFKLTENNIQNLNNYDKKQVELAIKNDITSQLNQDDANKKSIQYEKKIERALLKRNVNFKTQEDLILEQTKKHGHAVITPDFLFDQEIKINGQLIKWMEVKNFYGSNIRYFKNKVKKQLKKYQKKWGKGCVVFRYGFNDKLSFDNNLIISF